MYGKPDGPYGKPDGRLSRDEAARERAREIEEQREEYMEDAGYLGEMVERASARLGEGDPVAFLEGLRARLLTMGLGEDAKGVGLVADAIRGTLKALKGD